MRSDEAQRRNIKKRADKLGIAGVVGDGDRYEQEGVSMMEQARRAIGAKSEIEPDEA